jgi:exopolysaccharide biosynthesis protein
MVPFKDIDMDDFISIMKIYVVVNVVNLDGSNSSVLVKNSKILNEQRDRRIDLCYIFL